MMKDLQKQNVLPVESPAPLETREIDDLKPQIPHWQIVSNQERKYLRRTFDFADFAEALHFANHIGQVADEQNHHPRLIVEWGQVIVDWWSHTLEDLHLNDFIMAAKTDDIHARWDSLSSSDPVQQASQESFPASDPPGWTPK